MHVPTPDEIFSADTIWKLTVASAAVAGAFLVRNALEEGWKHATGHLPRSLLTGKGR